MNCEYERVLEEWRRFEARLPELTETLAGRWVVFRDDTVHGAYDDEEAAYVAAVETFGRNGGFVISRVEPQETIPLTAAVMFGTR